MNDFKELYDADNLGMAALKLMSMQREDFLTEISEMVEGTPQTAKIYHYLIEIFGDLFDVDLGGDTCCCGDGCGGMCVACIICGLVIEHGGFSDAQMIGGCLGCLVAAKLCDYGCGFCESSCESCDCCC